ncbi:MAG TPA: hypothetical protein VD859_00295 [Nocardioides sp.]|nr:hypothetical protein [Nocardioides sp.]
MQGVARLVDGRVSHTSTTAAIPKKARLMPATSSRLGVDTGRAQLLDST